MFDSDYLMHYGIKGMKWGKKKQKNKVEEWLENEDDSNFNSMMKKANKYNEKYYENSEKAAKYERKSAKYQSKGQFANAEKADKKAKKYRKRADKYKRKGEKYVKSMEKRFKNTKLSKISKESQEKGRQYLYMFIQD